ncbi:MAG: FHA domain-containing protein, partial [Gammaproteobacteria bacterium]
AIGRHEEPFSGYDSRLVTRLSRRHARIFEQDGVVYLADLGSLNGTTVNGRPVDKVPVKLSAGDELCFAGLCFQAEILGVAASQPARPAASPVKLILRPENPDYDLEPIVISQFPFLVNKKSQVFTRYLDRLGDQVRYLSRRHAHIFQRHGVLYIEDLGSTNGTYVSGVRLEEHARELRDGEVIALGGDCFVYRVELVHEEAKTSQQATGAAATAVPAGEDVTRTTFVTSANSFLDIFCVEEPAAGEEQDEAGGLAEGAQAEPDARTGAPARGWRTPFARLRTAFGEIRNALAEEPGARRRRRWPGWLALLAVAAAVAAVYVTTAPQRDIENLMERGEYQQAAEAASRYLETHEDDDDVASLATEATLKAIGPAWVEAVMAGDFAAAERALQRARGLGAPGAAGRELIEVMDWVARLERFIDTRGGPEAPLVMFEQEDRINELLAWWDVDPSSRHRSLGAIVQAVPTFAELRSRALSHQRVLQSHKALDLAAIERLRSSVERRLASGRAAELRAEMLEFGKRYPRIEGEDRLQQDLDLYLPIEAHIAAGNWLQAREALDQADFQTPPFLDRAAVVAATLLPPPDVMARYEAAFQAWRDGAFERATRLLEALGKTRWPEPAVRELARSRQVEADFEELQQAKGTPEYDERLLAFYSGLDPVQDRYFVEAVDEQFERHREKALDRARQAYEKARVAWSSYTDKGGIRGLHRLEAGVSSSFRRLAAILSESYADISYATRLYDLLDAEYPEAWQALYADISNEVRLQRRSLAELSMVLEPSLKQAKLDLIPVVVSEQPGSVQPDLSSEDKQRTQ